jgi:hypothetical protein
MVAATAMASVTPSSTNSNVSGENVSPAMLGLGMRMPSAPLV